jgi:hypothetical protein
MAEPAKNDITGDTIITKPASEKYAEGYERIFMGNKKHKDNQTKESNRDHGGRSRR